jgi:tRNA-2-methylthio-N6-dimethylallyladenosine synthase
LDTAKLHNFVTSNCMTYQINTYGCQMNAHDSEKIAGILEKNGFLEWDESSHQTKKADLIIFNTCCVRDHAEARVFGNIGALREAKENNPDMVIAVCGCMMQQEGMEQKISRRFPFVDIIFGTHNLDEFEKYIHEVIIEKKKIRQIQEGMEIIEDLPIKRAYNKSAYATIMYGCDNYCSYCIVPYVRGRERSRDMEAVVQEVRGLAKQGYVEITLLGQNVNSYGGNGNNASFPQLLRTLNEIDGLEFIRFMTSHPKDLSDELIEVMARCDKICKHIHLPVQSGSNRILTAMNRCYSREHYLSLIHKLRAQIPDIAVTTDIIVGFPGETEDDFEDTLRLMEQVRFTSAFTFMYSVRTGTKAADMQHQIDKKIKKQRLHRLNALQNQIIQEDAPGYINKTMRVMVDEVMNKKDEVKAKAENTKTVFLKGDPHMIGKVYEVKIKAARAGALVAEII